MTKFRQGRSGLFLPASTNYNGNAKVVRFGGLRIWAEEGLVNWVVDNPDAPDNGKSGSLSVYQARRRFTKVFASVGTATQLGIARDAYDVRELKKVSDDLEDIFKQAEEQSPRSRPVSVTTRQPRMVWKNQRTLVEED